MEWPRWPWAKCARYRFHIASRHIEELEADARYHRERHELYRAKSYGEQLTSPAKLRELARISEAAEARLEAARRAEREREA